MVANQDSSRLDSDIELQDQNSRRNSYELEQVNQFAIDEEDDSDLIYHPRLRNKRLSSHSGDVSGLSLKQRIRHSLSLPHNRRRLTIFSIVIFVIWLVLLISFANQGAFSNGNKPVPVANGTTGNADTDSNKPPQDSTEESAIQDSDDIKPMTLEAERMGSFYVFRYSLDFLDIPGLDFDQDEGLYLHTAGSIHFLRKASDPEYNAKLYEMNEVQQDGRSHHLSFVEVSSQLKKVLLVSEQTAEWRHSSYGVYWILDIESGEITPLYKKDDKLVQLSFAQFSPLGNYITFVYENNIYLLNLKTSEIIQVTKDGSSSIFNGKPDWVYEEEVLGSDRAIYWCPDESHFAFIKFDDSKVPEYDLEFFKDGKYPVTEKLKYPKPGYDNPIASVFVYSPESKSSVEVKHEGTKLGFDFVVYQVAWINANELLVKETDRTSRNVDVRVFKTEDGSSTVVRSYNTNDYEGWYVNNGDIFVVPTGGYIDTVVDNYRDHLAYFESATSAEPKIITTGDWDVVDGVAGYGKADKTVYFIGTAGNALEHQIYQVKLDGSDLRNLTNVEDISSYSLSVSSAGKYGFVQYKGPNLPTDKIVTMSTFSETNEEYVNSKNLNTAKLVADDLQHYQVPLKEYKTVTLEDGTTIDVIEVKPYNFNPENKYPVLVSVYGGPGAQKLSASFGYGFEEVSVSGLEIVVWYIDPRGTGGRGWKYKSFAKDKIGYWEPRDIVETAQRLIEQTDYIDMDLTAIWGWSYGGFTTLKTLEYDAGTTFKYGMAVAPVTNWELYDSIYTERYMGKPPENGNYESVSKIVDVNGFKQVTRFLVMHGTADDNVHFQNTLHLLDEFDKNGVENYDMHVFPDSNHNIAHNNANTIVYDKLYSWLKAAFDRKFTSL